MSSDVIILFILHCLGNICFGCSSVGISDFSSCRGFECSSSQVVECSSCRVFRVLRFRVFEFSSFRDFEFSNCRVLLGSGTDRGEGRRVCSESLQTRRPVIIFMSLELGGGRGRVASREAVVTAY